MNSPLSFRIEEAFFGSNIIRARAQTPGGIISLLLPNIIMIAGIVFFFLILAGGFGLIVGAGKQASPQEAAKAKNTLTYGIVGFLLVVSAYFILQMMSTIFGINFMSPGI